MFIILLVTVNIYFFNLDVEKERSLLANVPPNMYESNVCLPELTAYLPPPAHHYNNNNNTGQYTYIYNCNLFIDKSQINISSMDIKQLPIIIIFCYIQRVIFNFIFNLVCICSKNYIMIFKNFLHLNYFQNLTILNCFVIKALRLLIIASNYFKIITCFNN